MARIKLGNTLALTVAAVAVLNTVSALSMPVRDRKPPLGLALTWLVLLAVHAAAYRFGDRIRERFDLRGYAMVQAVILFAIAVSRPPMPITMGVFVACTVEMVVLAGARWGSTRITIGAIALYVLAALLTSSLYFAATAGLILAVTGLVAHAVAGLLERRSNPPVVPAPSVDGVKARSDNGLSAREIDVLRELVSGARNSDIAGTLGISERTVKSHLGSIYQKLGVESRAAAVATAVQRKLV